MRSIPRSSPIPPSRNVQTGVAAFKKSGADCIVAIGGGSSMDTAKAIGIIIANPEFEDVRSLEGVAPTKHKCVPIIAVPTTAGTAAEVTINYVITDVQKNRKMVCVDVHDIPVVAVVDPDTDEQHAPRALPAATGMDALTHAIEGYITKSAWAMSDMFHLKAIEIISKNLRGAVATTPRRKRGHGTRSVHRRHGLLQRRTRHRSLDGTPLSVRSMIPLTASQTPFFCPPSWNTTPRLRARSTRDIAKGDGCRGRGQDDARRSAQGSRCCSSSSSPRMSAFRRTSRELSRKRISTSSHSPANGRCVPSRQPQGSRRRKTSSRSTSRSL